MEILKTVYQKILEGEKVGKITWFTATRKEKEKLKSEFPEIQFDNYKHSIDLSALNHIKSRHGKKSRDHFPIEANDFLLIPQIIFQADEISYTERDRIGNRLIVYKKRIGNLYYYVEEIRTGRKELACKTMYKSS